MNGPYRIRLVESMRSFPMGTMDLWILERLADRTERILRAPDGPAGGLWEPTPDPHTVWDIPPTLQLPTDALGALRDELDRVLTGRPPLSADAYAAQVDLLREQRDLEAGRVDWILGTLLDRPGPKEG